MNIENKLKIITNHHSRLLERFHSLGTHIAQLTALGCIDAKEYWKNDKYLYLLYSMKNGRRKKKYVGNHPLRVKEAQQKLQNYKDRLSLVGTQEKVQSELDEIEYLTDRLLQLCSKSDLSAMFAQAEKTIGDKNISSRRGSARQLYPTPPYEIGYKSCASIATRCTQTSTGQGF